MCRRPEIHEEADARRRRVAGREGGEQLTSFAAASGWSAGTAGPMTSAMAVSTCARHRARHKCSGARHRGCAGDKQTSTRLIFSAPLAPKPMPPRPKASHGANRVIKLAHFREHIQDWLWPQKARWILNGASDFLDDAGEVAGLSRGNVAGQRSASRPSRIIASPGSMPAAFNPHKDLPPSRDRTSVFYVAVNIGRHSAQPKEP